LVYEWYENGYSDSSYTNPFSATKSVVGILTGVALKEGKIKSLDEPIANYLPEYRDSARSLITFKNLLTMSSGLNYYDNALNPFGSLAHLYYGRNVRKFINTLKVEKMAGSNWRYKNADTEILSIAVANAVGMKLSDYASQKLWQPIGAERDAKWVIDDQKNNAVEKAYCCFYTNAHDLAKVGMLYEHHGNVRGTQIVDSSYVQAAIQPVNIPNAEKGGKPQNHYGYSWWTENVDNDFHMDGMRGQYVIVLPKDDIIVVRLGKKDWYQTSKRFKPETPNFYGLIVRKVRATFGN
ncbi:MAG TPA: serine hydrolase, partial [Chitinophagales bacterium]